MSLINPILLPRRALGTILSTPTYTFAAHYATAKKGKQQQQDPRLIPMRKAFNPYYRKYRSNLETALHRAIPSVEAHETIHRAWQLYQRHQREQHHLELTGLLDKMRVAVEELKQVDKKLFYWATIPRDPRRTTQPEAEALRGTKRSVRKALEARIEGLFPRELRTPTETPSVRGWDDGWRPPK